MFGHLTIRQITRYTEKERKEENKKSMRATVK